MKISDIFTVIQGHQITDEELYNSSGKYPVFTGNNEVKGYWGRMIVGVQDLPCISYPTKANSGGVFIQKGLFDANNTAVLIPKPEWRKKIHLEWFRYKLPSIFLKNMTSKSGVSYLNKEIVEDTEINLPNIDEQIVESKYFEKLNNLKEKLINIKKKLDSLTCKNLIINADEIEETLISNIFNYISRNDVLSEQGVYNHSILNKTEEIITVLSGSVQNIVYGRISANSNNIHYLKDRQCLHVITRGKAGKITYINRGTYATNTNAYLIYIERGNWERLGIINEQQEEIYLKFMAAYLQPYFYQEVSMGDVGVFAISEIMKKLLVPLFRYEDKMLDLINYYTIINTFSDTIKMTIKKIDDLINKDIIKVEL